MVARIRLSNKIAEGAEVELSSKVQKIADKLVTKLQVMLYGNFCENFILPFQLIDFKVEGANRENNLEIINAKLVSMINYINFLLKEMDQFPL